MSFSIQTPAHEISFPPLLFGPLSGNIMACFSQIKHVFEMGEPTNRPRRAEEISPPSLTWSTFTYTGNFLSFLSCYKTRWLCIYTASSWGIVLLWQVRGSSSIYLAVCRDNLFNAETALFNGVTSFWWVNIVSQFMIHAYNGRSCSLERFILTKSFESLQWSPYSISHCPRGVIVQNHQNLIG